MKALVGTFIQEKILVGVSVIVKPETDGSSAALLVIVYANLNRSESAI